MNLDFEKGNGLVPVIIQDDRTQQVLMLGYMNEEALELTQKDGRVHFFSRTKNRIWLKGETSENYLYVKSIKHDCDSDALLIQAKPAGNVCHTGTFSCFEEKNSKGFLYELEETISERIDQNIEKSYTYDLYQRGFIVSLFNLVESERIFINGHRGNIDGKKSEIKMKFS